MTDIGKIEGIPPRDAWAHEAHHFTPWLAENLDQLGDAIGLTLEAEGTEVSIGPFSADILAKDLLGRVVLIENQLEATDHSHLGQILTYLSGLEAEIIIWVATHFREQHLSAINWLNENTNDKFSFFAIQLRVIRINESLPAPIFEVLARPNEWERSMQKKVKEVTGEASALAKERREFWKHYLDRHPEDSELGIKVAGGSNHWVVKPNKLELIVSIYKAKDAVGVFIRGERGVSDSEIKEILTPYANQLDQLLGKCKSIGWDDHKLDMKNRDDWDDAVEWLHKRTHDFLSAITKLDP